MREVVRTKRRLYKKLLSSSSNNDTSENKATTQKLRHQSIANDKQANKGLSNVCKKQYSEITEHWFKYKICTE